jgi:hypothetical protein
MEKIVPLVKIRFEMQLHDFPIEHCTVCNVDSCRHIRRGARDGIPLTSRGEVEPKVHPVTIGGATHRPMTS